MFPEVKPRPTTVLLDVSVYPVTSEEWFNRGHSKITMLVVSMGVNLPVKRSQKFTIDTVFVHVFIHEFKHHHSRGRRFVVDGMSKPFVGCRFSFYRHGNKVPLSKLLSVPGPGT